MKSLSGCADYMVVLQKHRDLYPYPLVISKMQKEKDNQRKKRRRRLGSFNRILYKAVSSTRFLLDQGS